MSKIYNSISIIVCIFLLILSIKLFISNIFLSLVLILFLILNGYLSISEHIKHQKIIKEEKRKKLKLICIQKI